MKNCGGTISNMCGTKASAACIEYQTSPPTFSALYGDDCVSVEEAVSDTYQLIKEVRESQDVTSLTNECITFNTPITAASAITDMYAKICDLQAQIVIQGDLITTMQGQITNLQANNCP